MYAFLLLFMKHFDINNDVNYEFLFGIIFEIYLNVLVCFT